MRPLTLEFQAFGSYPGREFVDFGPLSQRGLFVVTGATGTGKTTIFDAMAYALYGKLPGARASAGRERSDHADTSSATSVTLVFEVHGQRYRVERSPQQEALKKSGEGTTNQAAKASLVKVVGDGDEPIATGVNPVSEACERLVGLGPAEFQKVVLLPQGEFSRFLIARDAEREVLLRELFTGTLYGDTTQWLKDRMNELVKEVDGVDEQVRHLRKSADAAVEVVLTVWDGIEGVSRLGLEEIAALGGDELRTLIGDLEPAAADVNTRFKVAARAAEAATAELARAGELAQRFDKAASVRTTLGQLAATEATVVGAAVEADLSARARPVVAAATELARRQGDAERAAAAAEALAAQLATEFESIEVEVPAFDATAVAAAVERERAATSDTVKLLKVAAETAEDAAEAEGLAAEVDAEVEVTEGRVTAGQKRCKSLRTEIADLEPLAATLASTSGALIEAQRVHLVVVDLAREVATRPGLANDEAAAREARERAMRLFVTSQAPRLAQSLVPGDPCVVCGSTVHPAPAVVEGETFVDYDTVTAAQSAADKARDALGRVDNKITAMVAELGDDADTSTESATERLEQARECAEAADRAVDLLGVTRDGLSALMSELERDMDELTTLMVAASGLRGSAATRRAEADRLATVCAGIDADQVVSRSSTIGRLGVLSGEMTAVADAVTATATRVRGAATALGTVLDGSGFASVEIAAGALLPETEETGRHASRETWKSEWLKATEALRVLDEQGIPDTRPDTTDLDLRVRETRSLADSLAASRTTGLDALAQAVARLDEVAEVAAGSAELRERRDTVRRAYNVCNGESPRLKVKLERWVLAHELDRVTRQANVHLERMTNHRFRLRRSLESGQGLTLEVVDAHTGRERGTASLSGGEQFQASLALALGLADVISQGGTASGKQFEALFVDEGFGSLDPVALDSAIDALSAIQATGRMVGAITHVEGMKDRLHVGIEVSRLPGDRGSTLRVHP